MLNGANDSLSQYCFTGILCDKELLSRNHCEFQKEFLSLFIHNEKDMVMNLFMIIYDHLTSTSESIAINWLLSEEVTETFLEPSQAYLMEIFCKNS